MIHLDYEIQVILDGTCISCKLIVPESGQWSNWPKREPGTESDEHWGLNPRVDETTPTDIPKSVYDVSGYRVRDKGAQNDLSFSTPTSDQNSSRHTGTTPSESWSSFDRHIVRRERQSGRDTTTSSSTYNPRPGSTSSQDDLQSLDRSFDTTNGLKKRKRGQI